MVTVLKEQLIQRAQFELQVLVKKAHLVRFFIANKFMRFGMQFNTLDGKYVQLEPLHEAHREGLELINQDETIWTYFTYSATGLHFQEWFENTLKEMEHGKQFIYIVRCKREQKIIGCTRYYDIMPQHKRLIIGHTWYAKSARGTAVNPECKFLLLKQAFELLDFNRVELATDSRNTHSRAAIKKLGAVEEGLLRQHIILDNGYIRDTVLFSIIKPEWPDVKEKLQARL